MIAAERRRQVDAEGWTPEHDDEHEICELAMAAVAYSVAAIDECNAAAHAELERALAAGNRPVHSAKD